MMRTTLHIYALAVSGSVMATVPLRVEPFPPMVTPTFDKHLLAGSLKGERTLVGQIPNPDERLMSVADAAVQSLKIPGDQMRFQAASDLVDLFPGAPPRLVSRTFLYRRILGGIPAYGPGTSIQATVGVDGDLLALVPDWPTDLPVSLPADAYSHLDPVACLEAELSKDPPPRGCRLSAVGIRYATRRSATGNLEAFPAVLVHALPLGAQEGDPGDHLLLPLPTRP